MTLNNILHILQVSKPRLQRLRDLARGLQSRLEPKTRGLIIVGSELDPLRLFPLKHLSQCLTHHHPGLTHHNGEELTQTNA